MSGNNLLIRHVEHHAWAYAFHAVVVNGRRCDFQQQHSRVVNYVVTTAYHILRLTQTVSLLSWRDRGACLMTLQTY